MKYIHAVGDYHDMALAIKMALNAKKKNGTVQSFLTIETYTCCNAVLNIISCFPEVSLTSASQNVFPIATGCFLT